MEHSTSVGIKQIDVVVTKHDGYVIRWNLNTLLKLWRRKHSSSVFVYTPTDRVRKGTKWNIRKILALLGAWAVTLEAYIF